MPRKKNSPAGIEQVKQSVELMLDNLTEKHRESEVRQEEIRRQQQKIVDHARELLKKVNQDLVELRSKLEQYLDPNGGKLLDEDYVTLKDTYIRRLQERMVLERTIILGEDTIVASQLHVIPGEEER